MRFLPAAFLLILFSCSTPKKEQVQFLAGYWEIEKVEFPSGETKTYAINEHVDYIELKNDTTGIRKKLKPKADGSFSPGSDAEEFHIAITGKKLYLNYRTPFSEWKEEVLKVSSDQLITINDQKLKYFYKRYKTLTIE